jgi:hypothetical protein
MGKVQNLDPDSMDYDIFSGDMMASWFSINNI